MIFKKAFQCILNPEIILPSFYHIGYNNSYIYWALSHLIFSSHQLIEKGSTCHGVTKSMGRSHWSLECPRACATQQEALQQWEACSLQLEKATCSNEDPAQPPSPPKWKIIASKCAIKIRKFKTTETNYGVWILFVSIWCFFPANSKTVFFFFPKNCFRITIYWLSFLSNNYFVLKMIFTYEYFFTEVQLT